MEIHAHDATYLLIEPKSPKVYVDGLNETLREAGFVIRTRFRSGIYNVAPVDVINILIEHQDTIMAIAPVIIDRIGKAVTGWTKRNEKATAEINIYGPNGELLKTIRSANQRDDPSPWRNVGR